MFVTHKKIKTPEESEALQGRVNKAKLPIIAELGHSQISIREFLGLAVGDVISLDKSVDEGLQVKVGDKLKFIGNPGVVKGKVAIQINEIVSEGVEEDDE
jgi:flagellar motor switch protein FliM